MFPNDEMGDPAPERGLQVRWILIKGKNYRIRSPCKKGKMKRVTKGLVIRGGGGRHLQEELRGEKKFEIRICDCL